MFTQHHVNVFNHSICLDSAVISLDCETIREVVDFGLYDSVLRGANSDSGKSVLSPIIGITFVPSDK
jgi:hypothetical protein